MDTKLMAGRAWGVPIAGATVSLNNVDTYELLRTVSGLAKVLVGLGVAGLALGAMAASASTSIKPIRRSDFPWTSLCEVETYAGWPYLESGFLGRYRTHPLRRKFSGVCLNDEIIIVSDSHTFNIPVTYIKDYKPTGVGYSGFLKTTSHLILKVDLFDGSTYKGILLSPQQFEFLTPLGKQYVESTSCHAIYGCSVEDVEMLKARVAEFLMRESRNVETMIGEENFFRFFVKPGGSDYLSRNTHAANQPTREKYSKRRARKESRANRFDTEDED